MGREGNCWACFPRDLRLAPLSTIAFDNQMGAAVHTFGQQNVTHDAKARALQNLFCLYQELPWWDEVASQGTPHAVATAYNLAGFLLAFAAPDQHGEYWSNCKHEP